MKNLLKSKRVRRILLRAGFILVFIAVALIAFSIFMPGLRPLLKNGNQEEIVAYLEQTGGRAGVITVFALQIMQVVSVVVPGLPIQFAAGIIYGWWKAFLICYSGFVIGNTAVFLFARHTGGQAQLPDESKNAKVQWFLNRMRNMNPRLAVAVGYLIPGVPNGMLPHVAARSSLSLGSFIAAVSMSSWIQIVCNCIAGGFIIKGQYGFFVMTIIVQILLILFIIWKRNWFMKGKYGILQKRAGSDEDT